MSHRPTLTSPLPSPLQQLEWVLLSPTLVHSDWHWPLADRQEVLAKTQRQPEALFDLLNAQTDKRLGAQFESYLAYGLQHSNYWQLLKWGYVVRQQQGKIVETIGEMDFIIRNRQTDEVLQLEVAAKFYIAASQQTEAGNLANHWLGPAKRDSLGRKLDHMQQHQLALWQQPIARAKLATDEISIDRSAALIKGRLFYPPTGCLAPTISSDDHLRGLRCQQCEMPELEPNPQLWQPLTKLQWLASASDVSSEMGRLRSFKVALERPQQYLLHSLQSSQPRWVFVLPDGW